MATPGEVQQAIHAAVSAAAQHWQDAASGMQRKFDDLRGGLDASQAATRLTAHTSLTDTRLFEKPDSFDGGAGWKDWSIVFRSYACILGATHGTCRAVCSTVPPRGHAQYRPFVLSPAVLHAGDDLQKHRLDPSCERWFPGGLGWLETPRAATRTDTIHTQCRLVARTLELQFR